MNKEKMDEISKERSVRVFVASLKSPKTKEDYLRNLERFRKYAQFDAFSRYRKRAGLTQKYESTNRHHVSLHSFRSYFFTRARRIHDTDIAHAMVGHTTYLDMYDRKDDSEKLELYLKIEPNLSIFN